MNKDIGAPVVFFAELMSRSSLCEHVAFMSVLHPWKMNFETNMKSIPRTRPDSGVQEQVFVHS
jgi:hypothetical protein